MAKNWSDAARRLFEAYPWRSGLEKSRAHEESELVAFGAQVELDDLPLHVRRWAVRSRKSARYEWRGESLAEATRAFEQAILSQALDAARGNVSAAARALKTTPRIVAYKARKHGLI
ncbi:MAG: helix-turn-helix domain-containing protein [Kiritimatiellia bacterium]